VSKKKATATDKPKAELVGTEKRTISYTCPVRGLVTQVVEVKKYKGQEAPEQKTADTDVAALLDMQEFEEAGFHEEKLN
jgi:hypothetical protein